MADVRDPDQRPDPDDLLARLWPENRIEGGAGRLKIFLGAAPGVGKTWEMLNQGRRRAADGTDVIAGLIETHGRAETEAQIGDLPLLARRTIPYRGQVLDEFDLDAALARRPGLLLVDELAHTNAPGSRHAKRWEDVVELLDAGISVWTTLNVQHLESLNDDIVRITGIRPAETLPDRLLDRADEIELVDLPPTELRQRLHDGFIYQGDTARRALAGFFREGNLAALREIALRRAAAHVDQDLRTWMRRAGVAGPWPAAEQVVALIAADGVADAVVRQASRLAQAIRAPWVVVHVEQPARLGGGSVREAVALAAGLGAALDLRATVDGDLAASLLTAIRSHDATHVVMGRAADARGWRRILGVRLGHRLFRDGPEFVWHVVPIPDAAPRRAERPEASGDDATWRAAFGTVALLAMTTTAGVVFRDVLPTDAADLVYLAVIVLVAAIWGTRPALEAALLSLMAWDFFFVQPIYQISIDRPRDLVTAVVFATLAVLTGSLAGRVRAEARAAAARIEGLRRIGAFSRKLGEPATEAELLAEVARQAASLGQAAVVLTGEAGRLRVAAIVPAAQTLDDGARAASNWAWTRGEPTGRNTATLPGTPWRFQPLETVRGRLGVLGISLAAAPTSPVLQTLEALADQTSIALERVRLAGDAARAVALEETQALRTALLASLGHDLRTPLASIRGAAETLRTAFDAIDAATRTDLLASIEQDVGLMARFLANITDLTRLESGDVAPRLAPVRLSDAIERAISRMENALTIAASVQADLVVEADEALLEQALCNVLDNARKYAPLGSQVRISGRTARGPNGRPTASIAIADEGVGIPAADLPHVFDRFFRVGRADRTAPGIGLGLAIARGFVVAMGGDVIAASPNPDASASGLPGTVVTLTLPLAAATLGTAEGGR